MLTFQTVCEDGVKLAKTYPGPGPEHRPLSFGQSVAAHATEQLIGRPGQAIQELATGKAFSPGSYVRRSMSVLPPKDPAGGFLGGPGRYLQPAILYMHPIMRAYEGLTSPDGVDTGILGEALGTAAGTTLGMPLGYLGSIVGSMLGGSLGAQAGRALGS